jgi:hypothetical protein
MLEIAVGVKRECVAQGKWMLSFYELNTPLPNLPYRKSMGLCRGNDELLSIRI